MSKDCVKVSHSKESFCIRFPSCLIVVSNSLSCSHNYRHSTIMFHTFCLNCRIKLPKNFRRWKRKLKNNFELIRNELIGTGFNKSILTLWPCSEESINCSYLFIYKESILRKRILTWQTRYLVIRLMILNAHLGICIQYQICDAEIQLTMCILYLEELSFEISRTLYFIY